MRSKWQIPLENRVLTADGWPTLSPPLKWAPQATILKPGNTTTTEAHNKDEFRRM
jgi:hypothetical protein